MNEQMIIVELTNNICKTDYEFDISKYPQIDWDNLYTLALEQSIFPFIYEKIKDSLPQKYRFTYSKAWLVHKVNADKKFNQAVNIKRMFDKSNIKYVFVKGFLISYLLYDDITSRQYGDIDFIISEDNIIEACNIMKSLGYKDVFTSIIRNSDIDISEFDESVFFLNGDEKAFVSHTKAMVELKKSILSYEVNSIQNALSLRETLIIKNEMLYSFSIKDLIVFAIKNMYSNFYSLHGINNDYCIRDILDFYVLVIKHQNIFTPTYIRYLEENGHKNHLSLCIDILREYFDKSAFDILPDILKNIKSKPDSDLKFPLAWINSIYTRLFNKDLRIQEIDWMLYNKSINESDAKITGHYNVQSEPYNVSRGHLDAPIILWMDPLVLNIFSSSVLSFGLGYDDKQLYLSVKIPNIYPDMDISFKLPKPNVSCDDDLYHIITFSVVQDDVCSLKSTLQDCKSIINLFSNHKMATISLPRHDEISHSITEKSNGYYVSVAARFAGNDICLGTWGAYGWMPVFEIRACSY